MLGLSTLQLIAFGLFAVGLAYLAWENRSLLARMVPTRKPANHREQHVKEYLSLRDCCLDDPEAVKALDSVVLPAVLKGPK